MGTIHGIIKDETKYFKNLTFLILDSTYKTIFYSNSSTSANFGMFDEIDDDEQNGYDSVLNFGSS